MEKEEVNTEMQTEMGIETKLEVETKSEVETKTEAETKIETEIMLATNGEEIAAEESTRVFDIVAARRVVTEGVIEIGPIVLKSKKYHQSHVATGVLVVVVIVADVNGATTRTLIEIRVKIHMQTLGGAAQQRNQYEKRSGQFGVVALLPNPTNPTNPAKGRHPHYESAATTASTHLLQIYRSLPPVPPRSLRDDVTPYLRQNLSEELNDQLHSHRNENNSDVVFRVRSQQTLCPHHPGDVSMANKTEDHQERMNILPQCSLIVR